MVGSLSGFWIDGRRFGVEEKVMEEGIRVVVFRFEWMLEVFIGYFY